MYRKTLKLCKRMQLKMTLTHFLLSRHVTCYHCFFSSKENLKWGAEMAHDEYQMQYFCSDMIVLSLFYINLPRMVDYDVTCNKK